MKTGSFSPLIMALAFLLAIASSNAARGESLRLLADGHTSDPSRMPIGVWLQDPAEAPWFKSIGINLFVGLWNGPTDAQIRALHEAEMPAIAAQNEIGLADRSETIVGWLQIDEPDNAQPNGWGGFDRPLEPSEVVASYKRMKSKDTSRPVLLNLGRGVALDEWRGRKARTNHPEDYPAYLHGADIASFDVYPAASREPEVRAAPWRVGFGVARLRRWTAAEKPVWAFIETGNIHGAGAASPAQVRAEVFSAIVNGASGIVYFVHQFAPQFRTNRLREDPAMTAAIKAINGEISRLAPAVNAPPSPLAMHVSSSPGLRIETTRRDVGQTTYLLAVNIGDKTGSARFSLDGVERIDEIEIVGDPRRVPASKGTFEVTFAPYQVFAFRLHR